jgi:hypothetical protein
MVQIKDKKEKYRIADKRMKATSCTRGFQPNPKTYKKSMNLTKQIIRQAKNNLEVFLAKKGVKVYEYR